MESLALYFLLFISQSLNISSIAPDNSNWKTVQNWKKTNNSWVFSAESKTIVRECQNGNYLYFPEIIHGIHTVYADGKLIYQSGDPTFNQATPFYSEPFLNCQFLKNASVVKWEVTSYSKYFSRFDTWPTIKSYQKKSNFFDIYINIMSSAALFVIAFLFLVIFYKKVRNELVFPFFFSAFFLSIYFLTCSYSPFSMITSHKIADIAVIWGVFFLLKSFSSEKLINLTLFKIYIGVSIISSLIILSGRNGDTIQFGTTLAVIFFIVSSFNIIYKIIKALWRNGNSKLLYFQLGAIASFLIFGNNDALHIIGLAGTYMLLPLGSVSGLSFLILAINQEVVLTYKERDNLLVNLEVKVDEKTRGLNTALIKLKETQAELIQTAKLASLGTLSAGIAHEINNSINYVNGALLPLERHINSEITDPVKLQKAMKLLNVMKEGANLTIEIIKSLRNYTGLNQAQQNDIDIHNTLKSVITILKNKIIKEIKIDLQIESNLQIYGSIVGLNQIFMNLINNAIDSMPNGGVLTIKAKSSNNMVVIEFSDTGAGISDEVKNRIFDPFFTTKEVGKGTGLGLHIVQKEIEKSGGKINLETELGKGTTFTLFLPINKEDIPEGKVA